MSSLPTLRTPRALVALLGGIALAGALGTATASAADTATPQIVMIDPAANLTAKVRTEERRGNDVGDTFRAIGKGFVADLDKADIARLNRDPDVLLVEPDRPMSIDASPGAPVPPVSTATAPSNDAFASSQAVGLDHNRRAHLVDVSVRGLRVGEGVVRRGGNAVAPHEGF
mgnify:CR=1 FL=1